MGVHQITPPYEASSPLDGNVRKRVCKACDRCRLKKSKCDGSSPCSRCKADNAICVFGERKKSHDKVYPKGYVEMLENQQAQLVTGLQELYKRVHNGQGWVGSPLQETTHGSPLTHDILDRLGALKQDGHPVNANFEEDLNAMQRRLIAGGAGFMKREASSDGGSDIDHSPVFEQTPQRMPVFTDPFSLNQFPPTPPNQSPHSRSNSAIAPIQTRSLGNPMSEHSGMNPALLQRQTWGQAAVGFEDNMDFINRFDSPVSFNELSSRIFQTQNSSATMNPCLPMRDWAEEEDFSKFFNPALV